MNIVSPILFNMSCPELLEGQSHRQETDHERGRLKDNRGRKKRDEVGARDRLMSGEGEPGFVRGAQPL